MSVTLQKNFDKIIKEIGVTQRERLKLAAVHVQKALKEKVSKLYPLGEHSLPGSPPGEDLGNLIKGIAKVITDDEATVGFKSPAYHAHLLEFGTGSRTTKKGKNSGSIAPRPFFVSTLMEEKETIKKIVSEPWLK